LTELNLGKNERLYISIVKKLKLIL